MEVTVFLKFADWFTGRAEVSESFVKRVFDL